MYCHIPVINSWFRILQCWCVDLAAVVSVVTRDLGEEMTDEELQAMINEFDRDHDGASQSHSCTYTLIDNCFCESPLHMCLLHSCLKAVLFLQLTRRSFWQS